MVSNYLNATDGACSYAYGKLENVIYLVNEQHLKKVIIDRGEAYIEDLTQLPLRINGFNISFQEESSLDERYKFQKTLSLQMNGYVSDKVFDGRYYAIIQSKDGGYFMINVDFPSKVTYEFNLSEKTNETTFTLTSLSNFPTLPLRETFEAVEPLCIGLNTNGINTISLLEKKKAALNTANKTITSTEDFKKINFLKKSASFTESFNGERVETTLQFQIPFDSYKPSWQYNLLEFLDNLYVAVVTPTGDSNKFYAGFNFGLQPSYQIQTSSQANESDVITVTLREMSQNGASALYEANEQQTTETRWRWVKRVDSTICYECIGLGKAKYLVKQEIDNFGNPTGKYQVLRGYENNYPSFNIVSTFSEEEIFDTNDCINSEACNIESNLPSSIVFNSITCNTYTFKATCDWAFEDIPSHIQIDTMSGTANSSYTITICNTLQPTEQVKENTFNIKCCKVKRPLTIKVYTDDDCIKNKTQEINCLSQTVKFSFEGSCRPNITSIDSSLSYTIAGNQISVTVPRNTSSNIVNWRIMATNCNCTDKTFILAINQDKTYEKWVEESGYICENGNSYKKLVRYTGITSTDISTKTDEQKKGTLIKENDTLCQNASKKYDFLNHYTCINGNKFKLLEEIESYDNGETWTPTGNIQLGDLVEENSSFCEQNITYIWKLSSQWDCDGVSSYYKYQKYQIIGEQDAIPVYPTVYSIDGDGEKERVLKTERDVSCGYFPVVTPMYRWTEMTGSDDYLCDVCGIQLREVATATTCQGYNKYSVIECQVSYDSGTTYETYSSTTGNLIETNSEDCGYTPDYFNQYFTTVALEDNTTFVLKNRTSSRTFQYSKDGTNWNDVPPSSTGTVTNVMAGEKVYWKSENVSGTTGFRFSTSGNTLYNVEGNIMSLCRGDNFINDSTFHNSNDLTTYMFSGSAVYDASKLILPATTLSNYCYYGMFSSCTSLTNAPDLPATTLSNYCYNGMFQGCTSLTKAPDLPATTLSSACYNGMFQGCTSLTKAPDLPATTLASDCYNDMFEDCTSLTNAPDLPATTLANYCYSFMFSRCTSLTKAPDLPATTLSNYCYNGMFSSCTSLTNAPDLPATTLSNYCYRAMFEDCTSLTKAPDLPATTLASDCYNDMFQGCTSLTKAPDLPATTLSSACYYGMFSRCTSLTKAPDLPATTLSSACYNDMFYRCTSLTKAPDLPATTLAYGCYSFMFDNCTSLTKAPALPATTLSIYCYRYMFYNCSKLSSITCLAESFGIEFCEYWVGGVASSGTFTCKTGVNWPSGTDGIPNGWTVNYIN